MVVKTRLNELILTEIGFNEAKDSYILLNPFIIEITESRTSASPFIPSTTATSFAVPIDYVIAMGPADKFITKFYGSMLYRSSIQVFLGREPFDGNPKDFNAYIHDQLASAKHEINEKFGMMEDDAPKDISKKVLH